MQDWQADIPVALGTVAWLMMSLSDNTATDLLIEKLGRASIESLSPFAPLMTTRDICRLKVDHDLEMSHAQADEAERRPGPAR